MPDVFDTDPEPRLMLVSCPQPDVDTFVWVKQVAERFAAAPVQSVVREQIEGIAEQLGIVAADVYTANDPHVVMGRLTEIAHELGHLGSMLGVESMWDTVSDDST